MKSYRLQSFAGPPTNCKDHFRPLHNIEICKCFEVFLDLSHFKSICKGEKTYLPLITDSSNFFCKLGLQAFNGVGRIHREVKGDLLVSQTGL